MLHFATADRAVKRAVFSKKREKGRMGETNEKSTSLSLSVVSFLLEENFLQTILCKT